MRVIAAIQYIGYDEQYRKVVKQAIVKQFNSTDNLGYSDIYAELPKDSEHTIIVNTIVVTKKENVVAIMPPNSKAIILIPIHRVIKWITYPVEGIVEEEEANIDD